MPKPTDPQLAGPSIDLIRGPRGPQGERGADGAPGATGATGAAGTPGSNATATIPPYQGNHAYVQDAPIQVGGVLYTRIAPGTSRASFDPTEQALWLSVGNNTASLTATVVYASGAYPARPTGYASVNYIGPTQPTSWLDGDTWTDNS